jgi:DNA-binding response OmpR family regulator
MHVLLVEDDDLVGEGVRTGLDVAGFTVDWVKTLREARLAIDAITSDLVVLDLGLPDGDGLTLIARWRKQGRTLPVLVLTARDTVADRVAGLDEGADDYLLKPFDLDELVARIHALLRRAAGHAGRALVHGPITLDPATRTVTRDGVEVELTRREFTVLQKMLLSRGIVSADQLKDSLYGLDAEEVESNTVTVHIHNLRRKFGRGLIRTVRGLGYRLGDPAELNGSKEEP